MNLPSQSGDHDKETIISNVNFFGTEASSPSAIFTVEQCPLAPTRSETTDQPTPRWFTHVSAYFIPSAPQDILLGTCSLYSTLEEVYNHTILVDPRMTVWSGINMGINGGDHGIFVPDYGVFTSYVMSHEMAHWTGCVGGNCDYAANIWMWEGLVACLCRLFSFIYLTSVYPLFRPRLVLRSANS